MENTQFPTLDSSPESLELINAFIPEFFGYLKTKAGAVDSLLLMHRNGNQKAAQIISYLVGASPVVYIPADSKNHKSLYQSWYTGQATYNITWSDLKINDSDKNNMFVVFDFEVLFEEAVGYSYIRRSILDARETNFRKHFLLEEISDAVKKKGFKLRRSNPKKDNGLLAPYVKIELNFLDWTENPEYPGDKKRGLGKRVQGKCSIQLLLLE